MTANNGWPGKPGVPPQDGVYWLKHNVVGDKQPCLYEKGRWYCCGSDIGLSPMRCAARYSYLGPCLTPDEAAKREDVKWHEGYAVGVLDVRRGTAFGEPDTHYAALQARAVKWAGIVGTLMAERDQLIGVLQIAIERSGDSEPRPAWVDGACGLLNKGFLKVDRAALAEAAALQKRVAELEGVLDQLLDDMRDGLCVCQQAKDEARAALEGKKDE